VERGNQHLLATFFLPLLVVLAGDRRPRRVAGDQSARACVCVSCVCVCGGRTRARDDEGSTKASARRTCVVASADAGGQQRACVKSLKSTLTSSST
jgi:predicted butyrate kinase (DUF1464 family)